MGRRDYLTIFFCLPRHPDQDDSYWNFKHFLEAASHPIYGRSEVYFSATVDLAKARRCFNKEPRYDARCDVPTKRCSSPIAPHFLWAGCYFTGEAHSFIGEVLRF